MRILETSLVISLHKSWTIKTTVFIKILKRRIQCIKWFLILAEMLKPDFVFVKKSS